MTIKIVSTTAIAMVAACAPSCSTQRTTDRPSQLTFVIDDVGDEQWSHFDDGSFDVQHTVTARITAPNDLQGRIVKVRINALAEVDTEAKTGTQWSVALPTPQPEGDQLQTLVYRRITRNSGES